jgi:tetratricopeptide (TPR) repeat protein
MSEKKNKLITFWESIEKAGDKIKINRAARSLQRQAEIDVASASDNYENELATFEKAKVDAKDKPETGFKNIYESYMQLKIKKKRFDDAVEVYKELFEEEPRLLN